MGNVYLNADWYKICEVCKKIWCSIKECQTPDCPCIQALTVDMIRKDEVRFVTCGVCEKQQKEWLERNDPQPIKQLRGKTIRIEIKKEDPPWDTDDAEADGK